MREQWRLYWFFYNRALVIFIVSFKKLCTAKYTKSKQKWFKLKEKFLSHIGNRSQDRTGSKALDIGFNCNIKDLYFSIFWMERFPSFNSAFGCVPLSSVTKEWMAYKKVTEWLQLLQSQCFLSFGPWIRTQVSC